MSTMMIILLLIYIVGIFGCFAVLRFIGGNLFEIDIILSLVWPLLLVFLLIGAPFYYIDEIIRKYKP